MNYKIFNLKPYLTFLSRNKAYALINVFGLSVSLMFVLLIGVYTMQEYSVDHRNSRLDRIYTVGMVSKDSTVIDGAHHYTQRLIRQFCPEVVKTGAAGLYTVNLKRPDGEILKTRVVVMDTTLFSILDFKILQGNAQSPLPDSHSAVVSESFAKRWFGEYEPMGKNINFKDSIGFRVTGVVADIKNSSMEPADIYISYPNLKYFNIADMDEYIDKYLNAAGMEVYLLTNGKTDLKGKEGALNEYLGKNFGLFDTKQSGYSLRLTPLKDLYFSKMETYSRVTHHGDVQLVNLLFAVGIVILLFAILNYVNLTVSQSGYRAREMATRRLFGGTRLNIITQLMGESVALCIISLVIAVLLSCAAAPSVSRLLSTDIDLTLLLRPVALLLIVAFVLVVGVLSGVLPSVIISRTTPIDIVRGTFRFHTKMRLSRVFIVVQNVVTIIMLGCALVMTMQMRHIINAPLGFNTHNVMSIETAVSDSTLNATFMQELRKQPFVVNVSACDYTPVDGGNNITSYKDGNALAAQVFRIDGNYMKILGLKVIQNNGVTTTPRVWVNKRYTSEWADSYRGRRSLKDPFYGDEYPIAGVVDNFYLKNITNGMMSVMLFEDKEVSSPSYFLIQVQGNAADAFNSVKNIYKQTFHMTLNADNPYIDQQVAKQFDREVRISRIVVLFALIAIVISLLGLIAMSTYFIQQRQKEIAVRKVFGSTGSQIRRRLITSFMVYVAVAVVIAVPLTLWAMSHWISTYGYRIVWWPWIVVACVICAVISLAAVYVQSYMAGNENPIDHIKDNG